MRSGKTALTCAKISLLQLFSNPNCILILAVMTIFSFYIYSPMCRISQFYQISVPPWLFPFYLSWYQMLLVHCGLCLLLFADTVEIDSYTNLMLVRIGRVPYILGYQLYILAASFLYTVVQVLLSALFILPVIGFDADWGVLIRTLAGSAGQVATQTGSTLSFVVSNEILSRFTPLKAMLVNFLCIWLSTAFVGFVICFFRIFFSKAAAVIVVGVLICLSLFVRFLGGMLIGTWLQYFSPLTWSNFAYLDWYYSGAAPSPAYAFTVWIGGIVLLGAASAIGFCKWDVRQTGR